MHRVGLNFEKALERWLRSEYDPEDHHYSSICLELKLAQALVLNRDPAEDAVLKERAVIVRAQAIGKDGRVSVNALENDRELNVDGTLGAASGKSFEVPILLPENKYFEFPSESIDLVKGEDIEDFFRWSINDDIVEDLRSGLNKSLHFPVVPRISLVQRRYVFADSNGIFSAYDVNNFLTELIVNMKKRQQLVRPIGFSPTSSEYMDRILRLLPKTVDFTSTTAFRESRSFAELIEEMDNFAFWLSKNSVNLNYHGPCKVVTFTGTPLHEGLAHQFEARLSLPPEHEGSDLINAVTFTPSAPIAYESLNFRDNPKIKLEGLPLIGARPLDLEGFVTKLNHHVTEGKVNPNSYLGSLFSNGSSVGNAISYTPGAIPLPRMTVNETLPDANGPNSVEDLCEFAENFGNADEPVIVTNKRTGACDYLDGNLTMGVGEHNPEVFIYQNGHLTPIKNPHVLSGDVYRAVRGMRLAGSQTMSFDVHYCGKENLFGGYDYVMTSQAGPLCVIPLSIKTQKAAPSKRIKPSKLAHRINLANLNKRRELAEENYQMPD